MVKQQVKTVSLLISFFSNGLISKTEFELKVVAYISYSGFCLINNQVKLFINVVHYARVTKTVVKPSKIIQRAW